MESMAKTMLERIAAAKQLWALALPAWPVQTDAGLYRWCDRFSDLEIEVAFQKTSRKFFRLPNALPIEIYKYVSATLTHRSQDEVAALRAQTARETEAA
jgi:hypothetical protein